jgi:hypothetical protein
LGVLSDRKLQRHLATPFRREKLHGQARFRATSRRSCATAKALQESLEDMAMLKAIQQGEKTRLASRAKIFQRLARAA